MDPAAPILIAGAGSIGCYVGGVLADAGRDITLLGRGALAERVASEGLRALVDEVSLETEKTGKLLAVGVDARNRLRDIEKLPGLIEEFRQQDIQTEVLFVLADDEVLLKRYGETRRRHPLAGHGSALRTAIQEEREILSEIINAADLIIDTTATTVYQSTVNRWPRRAALSPE